MASPPQSARASSPAASPLRASGEDLLQAALADAFSLGTHTLPREPARSAHATPAPAPAPLPADADPSPILASAPAPIKPDADAEALGPEAYAAWKADYDAQLARWRAENAEARARAEAERECWAARRAQERESQPVTPAPASGPPSAGASSETWERVLRERHASGESPSPVDGRDAVTGEGRRMDNAGASGVQKPQSHTDAGSSPRWEDVPSDPSELASSFPSLSFPDATPEHSKHPSGSGSGDHRAHGHEHGHEHERHHHHHHDQHREQSTTLAVFDGALSPRTRLWALVAALGINLLLPFVNGVMLGVGEIFARDVLMGWLGWNNRGVGTAGAGVRWRR